MRKKKFIFSSLLTSFLVTAAVGIGINQSLSYAISNTSIKKNTNLQADATSQTTTPSSGLLNLKTDQNQNGQVSLPVSYYKQNSIGNFANANGPILLFDNARTVGATDWYGNLSWYITLDSKDNTNDGYYSESWFSTSTSSAIDFSKAGTKVVDMSYNYKTDVLYVLTDKGYLIIVDSKSGTIISANLVNTGQTSGTTTTTVDKIQVIDFDNSVYLWSSKTQNPTIYQVDPKTGVVNTANEIKSASATGLASKYLVGLIPLDVNYSIAVTSTSQVGDAASSVNLSLDIVNDKFVKYITDSTTQSSTSRSTTPKTSETVSLTSTKGSDIYMNGFARNGNYIIMVGKNIYELLLNKSSITKSNFTNLINNTTTVQTKAASGDSTDTTSTFTLSGNINSAFIDSNNQIYFKTDESENITSISVANVFTNSIVIQSSGSNVVFSDQTGAKNAQVFPVANPSAGTNALKSYPFTGYVLSYSNFVGTGFTNDSLMPRQFTSTSYQPQFGIQNISSNDIPSSAQRSNIASISSSVSGFILNNQNATMIADDYSGYLYVKVPYVISQPWYSNSATTANGYLIGRFKYQSVNNATTWNTSAFQSLFNKYEPNQIDENMLKAQATSIVTIPNSILESSNNSLDINFVITDRQENAGTIKVKATIKYVNSYGLQITYSLQEQQFNVKKAAPTYSFMFAGETNANKNLVDVTKKSIVDLQSQAKSAITNTSQTDFLSVDINSLGSTYATYANTLPSLWQVSMIYDFITDSSKYPTSKVVTILASDDTIGSVIILVQYNGLSNNTPSKFAIKYTGIINYSGATLKFIGNDADSPIGINGTPVFSESSIKDITTAAGFSDYKSKLASDVNANQLSALYSSPLISAMGFAPKVDIVKSSDASAEPGNSSLDMEYGSILLKLDFNGSQSSVLKNSLDEKVVFQSSMLNQMGLKNGVIYQRYTGFLPIGATYNINLNFKGDQYKTLIDDNNVNATVTEQQLLDILTINGYNTKDGDIIRIQSYYWDGEKLVFTIYAQSALYSTVNANQTFTVDWGVKFAASRNTSLAIAVITSIVGIAIIATGVALYVIRRNKIRKLMK